MVVNNDMKKIVIAAGGTGGHLYPGIALARELMLRGCQPIFIVTENEMCRTILIEEKFDFVEIPARGMPRRFSLGLVPFLYYLVRSFLAARVLIGRIRPAAVVGMGGYISFPVIVAATVSRIPTLIHEQNCLPGLANRILARCVKRVAVSFEESLSYFPTKITVVTGNPVRRDLFGVDYTAALHRLHLSPEKFTVLIFGGSQGAQAINQTVIKSWALLPLSCRENIQFLHVAGKKDYDTTAAGYRDNKITGIVLAYLHEIGDAYAVSDLIICRSGATTVAEIKMLGTPAILVPYPYATANHQEFNAQGLVKSGQAVMIIEKNLSPEIFVQEIVTRMHNFHREHMAIKIPERFAQQVLSDAVLALS
ncbi:MAG: undecaprenyldiphospho-muramoylpentapeptide beta-N-acetylglucosaminyltransferase [Endomicrobiales bacterium]